MVHQNHCHPFHRQKYFRNDDAVCSPTEPCVQTKMVFLKSIEVTGKIYTDQKGCLPITSSSGSKYIMVLYDHDINAIIAEPLKSRSEHELICAYTTLYTHLYNRGIAPQVQMLNSDCLSGLKQVMRNAGVAFQIVPPHLHRTNAAEPATLSILPRRLKPPRDIFASSNKMFGPPKSLPPLP